MNGASASLARRRLISVLPQPVGPIIRMFFGETSSRRSAPSRWRRQRLRIATATAFLASVWPMMCASSARTMALGVRLSLFISFFLAPPLKGRGWGGGVPQMQGRVEERPPPPPPPPPTPSPEGEGLESYVALSNASTVSRSLVYTHSSDAIAIALRQIASASC